jgi:hypothetical protein
MVSPGAAEFMAACRSPPAGTTSVDARVAEAEINKIEAMTKTFVIPGDPQRRAARTWEMDIFSPLRERRDR